MYVAFFGLADKPFAITPDPRYLYLGAQHADALAHLVYGINDAGGFIQLTGEVGTGKTTTIRSLLVRAPAQAEIALIVNPRLSPRDFLQTICEELGVALADGANASVKLLIDRLNGYLLQAHAAGRRVVLIVDEAQNLDTEVLEQVRLLTNLETESQKLLQIILIGQPELRALLNRTELRQLAQRITARYHLLPLAGEETAAYVRHRLRIAGATREIFTPGALREVHRLSAGVPRLINIICDRALLGAYTQDAHEAGTALVRRAAGEVFGRRVAPAWLLPAAGSLLLVAALAASAALLRLRPWAALPAAVPVAARVGTAAAAVPALPRLEEVLKRSGDEVSAEWAFSGLLKLWGGSEVPGATDGCAQAHAQGLECVSLRSSLAQLRDLRRPAVLLLEGNDGAGYQLLLNGIGAQSVQLQIGARSVKIGIAELSQHWFGDCLLLWHPAFSPVVQLRPGMHGAAVRALRSQLLQVAGAAAGSANAAADANAASDGSARFDADLSKLVEDFQRQHHLAVDGIAGVETQLLLDARLAAPGTPLLQLGPD
ncbi:MAG TPA: AAA family ATPase [Steroidobacteraceae bacterium]|nr:AAA family ATPase [Steroidobacteraceae bacterium]